MKLRKNSILVLRLLAAVILLQSLYFKFSGHEESVFIFSAVGMEPWGRYFIGILELIAALLLLSPGIYWLGGLLGAGLMAGAIFFHITTLGIEVHGDNGLLFYLSIFVFAASFLSVLDKRKNIPILKNLF